MYINSGNIAVSLNQKAQNLQTVKTPEGFTDRELARALRDAVIAEQEAIKQYEAFADATNNEQVKKTFQDIANEEKVHVGELQKHLDDLDSDGKFLEEGKEEVEDAGDETGDDESSDS